jgi:hypothetical protein
MNYLADDKDCQQLVKNGAKRERSPLSSKASPKGGTLSSIRRGEKTSVIFNFALKTHLCAARDGRGGEKGVVKVDRGDLLVACKE